MRNRRRHRRNRYLRYRDADSTARGTWGRRYIVCSLDQRTHDLTMRAELAMTSALSLQLYAQPFASSVDYDAFKSFQQAGAVSLREAISSVL